MASYTTTGGRYSVDAGYFNRTAVSTPPLAAPSAQNGVYASGSGFPTSSFQGGNYWVDVVYNQNTDNAAPVVTARVPAAGATGVALGAPVSATFDEPVVEAGLQFSLEDPGGARIGGAVTLSADRKTVTLSPSAPLAPGTAYAARLTAADASGNAPPQPETWSFTTLATQACPCSLFSSATVPTAVEANDTGAYEMGVRFTPAANGTVTAVKFYKGAGNTGTHTGTLWSAAGEQLATGTFSGETASGWQTLTFATPVAVTAGTGYVASYTTTGGRYSVDTGYFDRTAVSTPPLSAPAAGNGVYASGTGFPTSSFQGGNYWVDVVFVAANP